MRTIASCYKNYTIEKLKYNIEIGDAGISIDIYIDWIGDNIQNKWNWIFKGWPPLSSTYIFSFSDEVDYMHFMLRWK